VDTSCCLLIPFGHQDKCQIYFFVFLSHSPVPKKEVAGDCWNVGKHKPLARSKGHNFSARVIECLLDMEYLFFHISIIGGEGFCGNVEKSNSFLDFSKYCGKVWENPGVFPGFFHAFPRYGISIKHANILASLKRTFP